MKSYYIPTLPSQTLYVIILQTPKLFQPCFRLQHFAYQSVLSRLELWRALLFHTFGEGVKSLRKPIKASSKQAKFDLKLQTGQFIFREKELYSLTVPWTLSIKYPVLKTTGPMEQSTIFTTGPGLWRTTGD